MAGCRDRRLCTAHAHSLAGAVRQFGSQLNLKFSGTTVTRCGLVFARSEPGRKATGSTRELSLFPPRATSEDAVGSLAMTLRRRPWARAALCVAATTAAAGALAIASPVSATPNPAHPPAQSNANACAAIFAHSPQANLDTNRMAAHGFEHFFDVGQEFCFR
jgi:hypothetical protein